MTKPPWHLFDAFGIEIEFMLVDKTSLAPASLSDRLLHRLSGAISQEADLAGMTCSNELVLHVLEIKTPAPVSSIANTHLDFHRTIKALAPHLEALGLRLMPSAAHPWMNPEKEAQTWPHGNREIYEAFDSIFGCKTHGWTNLQSTHLNLPFTGDEEFGRLHAAVRFLLPIIPALSAASPYLDGNFTGMMDARIEAYRLNCKKVPSVTGRLVPEPLYTQYDYEQGIFDVMYREMEIHDPNGRLRFEWLNARGAIARFDRSAIEIRIIDAQECPLADCAIVWAIIHLLKKMVDGSLGHLNAMKVFPTESLRTLLLDTACTAEKTVIPPDYSETLTGTSSPCTAQDLWTQLLPQIPSHPAYLPALENILQHGPLARRMVSAAGETPDRAALRDLASGLCLALHHNRMFHV